MPSSHSLLLVTACLCVVAVVLSPAASLGQYTINAHEYSGYVHEEGADSGRRQLESLSSSSTCGTVHLKSFTVRVACSSQQSSARFSSSPVPLSGWRARRAKSLSVAPPLVSKQWLVVVRDTVTPAARSSLERVLSQRLHTYLPDRSFLVWGTSRGGFFGWGGECTCCVGWCVGAMRASSFCRGERGGDLFLFQQALYALSPIPPPPPPHPSPSSRCPCRRSAPFNPLGWRVPLRVSVRGRCAALRVGRRRGWLVLAGRGPSQGPDWRAPGRRLSRALFAVDVPHRCDISLVPDYIHWPRLPLRVWRHWRGLPHVSFEQREG